MTSTSPEIWKPITEFPGYEACDDGRIRSATGVLTSFRLDGIWPYVLVNEGGKDRRVFVGRLVWMAFNGPMEAKDKILYENGDMSDNRLENLSIRRRGGRNGNDKLTAEQVLELRRLRKEEGWTFARLGKHFGVSTSNAVLIVKRKTWKNI